MTAMAPSQNAGRETHTVQGTVVGRDAEDPVLNKLHQGRMIEQFLQDSASQLTYYGLAQVFAFATVIYGLACLFCFF
jgi:hypothetical protein